MSTSLVGAKAPDFELLDQDGRPTRLSDVLKRNNVVLYFYPEDETYNCIKEACNFREHFSSFTEAGAEVIGISRDSIASHKAFAIKRNLPFLLLSDEGATVHSLYGVNPRFLGLLRARMTFVIDRQGQIQHVFDSHFNVEGHVKESLAVLQRLQSLHV